LTGAITNNGISTYGDIDGRLTELRPDSDKPIVLQLNDHPDVINQLTARLREHGHAVDWMPHAEPDKGTIVTIQWIKRAM